MFLLLLLFGYRVSSVPTCRVVPSNDRELEGLRILSCAFTLLQGNLLDSCSSPVGIGTCLRADMLCTQSVCTLE